MELKNGGTTVGLGSGIQFQEEPGQSLEEILQTSETIDTRRENGIIKTLAVDETMLSKMPFADQPSQLKSSLLPYQRQVRTLPTPIGWLIV